MLKDMDRSTIHYLKQKGWTNTQIAAFVGHHRDTIARVLREPLDRQAAPRQRQNVVAVFHDQIQAWLDHKLSVRRMLEPVLVPRCGCLERCAYVDKPWA